MADSAGKMKRNRVFLPNEVELRVIVVLSTNLIRLGGSSTGYDVTDEPVAVVLDYSECSSGTRRSDNSTGLRRLSCTEGAERA